MDLISFTLLSLRFLRSCLELRHGISFLEEEEKEQDSCEKSPPPHLTTYHVLRTLVEQMYQTLRVGNASEAGLRPSYYLRRVLVTARVLLKTMF